MTKPRELEVGKYYHIYSRGVNRCETYTEDLDYIRFIDLLKACNTQKRIALRDFLNNETNENSSQIVNIFCYCLMPNHFHMIIKETTEGGISLFLQKILSGYSLYFNKKYKRTGALFGSRFKNKIIENDIYFNHLVTYIKNNPIKLINQNYKSESVLNGDYTLTEEDLRFADNYPYTSRGRRYVIPYGRLYSFNFFPAFSINSIYIFAILFM